jgi:hypothetical protein
LSDAELGKEQMKQQNLKEYTAARNALITSAGWATMSPEDRKSALDAIDKAYGMTGGVQTDAKKTKPYTPPSDIGAAFSQMGRGIAKGANALVPGTPFATRPNQEQAMGSEINAIMDEASHRVRPDTGQPELWDAMNPFDPQTATMEDFGEIPPSEILRRSLSGNSR